MKKGFDFVIEHFVACFLVVAVVITGGWQATHRPAPVKTQYCGYEDCEIRSDSSDAPEIGWDRY